MLNFNLTEKCLEIVSPTNCVIQKSRVIFQEKCFSRSIFY